MRKINTIIPFLLTTLLATNGAFAYNKGGEKMAALIFNEQFSDQNLTGRGWNQNPGSGYIWENDSTLNKQVVYARWTNGNTGMPDGNASTFARNVPVATWNSGITMYYAVKFHNFIMNGNRLNSHSGMRASVNGVYGNADGEIMIDAFRNGFTWRVYPANRESRDRSFITIFQHAGGREVRFSNPDMGKYIDDDIWYEHATYMDTDNGGNNGVIRMYYRVYGDTDWIEIMNASGLTLINVPTTKPFVGYGPYFHQNASPNEVRAYVGWIAAYQGDAVADGTLGDIGGGDNGGDNGNGNTDPLTISNHNVKTTETSAKLTWRTNKPSNSVADVGTTEERGTFFRGNTDTTDHVIDIDGLIANTTYYYRYSSRTADGETVMDQENSTFTTKATGGGDNGGGGTEPSEVSLAELTDVALSSPAAGQALVYDGENWVNTDLDALVEQKVNEALTGLDAQIEKTVIAVLERAKIVVS